MPRTESSRAVALLGLRVSRVESLHELPFLIMNGSWGGVNERHEALDITEQYALRQPRGNICCSVGCALSDKHSIFDRPRQMEGSLMSS
jgi:hypothetical protein